MKNELPKFPKFEKLSLEHKEVMQEVANNFPSSDFNFAGLFTWDIGETVKVSSLNENLVIRTSDYLTHDKFYSFVGNNRVDETIRTIIDYAKKHKESTELKLITESVAKYISPESHNIVEDRDNFDYIHLVSDFAELSGGKYRRKRNTLNGFIKSYGDKVKNIELDLSDEKVKQDIEQVINRWQISRNKKDKEVKDELVAIKKALNNLKILDLRVFGVYHNKTLIAFTIFEILPNKVSIGHFERADIKYEGIFIYLKHSLAKHLAELGVETFNTEQDLGIAGLRKHKESYHPVEFIKKYTVTRKD